MSYKTHVIKNVVSQLSAVTVHKGYEPISCRELFTEIENVTKEHFRSSVDDEPPEDRYRVLFIRDDQMTIEWRPVYEKRTPSHGRLSDGRMVVTANLQGGRRVGVDFLQGLFSDMKAEATQDKEVLLRRSKTPHALWLFLS